MRSTVLVFNIGSRSFRLLFLPDGAQEILVGAFEVEDLLGFPFKEIYTYWGFLGFVEVWGYHVYNTIELAEFSDIADSGSEDVHMESIHERTMHWRDHNILLQPPKLQQIVLKAQKT